MFYQPPYPGAEILYTLDGSDPSAASTVYESPLTFDESVELRAGMLCRQRQKQIIAVRNVRVHKASAGSRSQTSRRKISQHRRRFVACDGLVATTDFHDKNWNRASKAKIWKRRSSSTKYARFHRCPCAVSLENRKLDLPAAVRPGFTRQT